MIKHQRRYLDDREKQRRWLDPRVYSVRVADLQAYLMHKGWKQVPPDRPGFLIFEEPARNTEQPLYLLVPESEEWEGYFAQVYDLIAALAQLEDRYAGEVLTEILQNSGARSGNGVAAAHPSPATPQP